MENKKETALVPEEALAEAEVNDDTKEKPEQKFNLRDVPPEIEKVKVTCIYCGKEGKAGDLVESDRGLCYEWHNLPTTLYGEGDLGAVCQACTKEKGKELRQQHSRWFQNHHQLPVLPYTLEKRAANQKKTQELKDKARQWGESRGIHEDTSRTCSVCGVHHGELVETREPYFHFLVMDVSTVVGTPANRAERDKSLLCRDCRRDALAAAKEKGVYLKLQRFEETEEGFQRQGRLDEVLGKGVETRYEPLDKTGRGGGRRRKPEWKKTA